MGDVNGDGLPDVAAGPDLEAAPGFSIAFGPGLPGAPGLRVTHVEPPEGGTVGGGIAGVGDWNGDGLADVALGYVGASPHGRVSAGSVYVVLGRRAPGEVDVRSDPGVVRIDGPARRSAIGDGLAGVGDVDGDGRPDLAIPLSGGRAVIVRGGLPGGTALDLAHPPPGSTIALRGLLATRAPFGLPPAAAFAPAGDLDGDGRGELLAGVSAYSPLVSGRVLVLRGVPGGTSVDVRDPRARLARVAGPPGDFGFGTTVATVPDTDGDGHPEWLIGAAGPPGLSVLGGPYPNTLAVVLSRARGEVRPGRAGQPAVTLRLNGQLQAGRTLAGVPDVTGDGVPDFLVGLPDASPACRGHAGAVALVAGRATPGRVRLGPRIDGSTPGAALGTTLAVAGDAAVVGGVPFENAAFTELWRVPLSRLASPSPALPAAGRCLKVTLARRTRAQLRRTGRLPVVVRSDAGDGRAHRVRIVLEVIAGADFADVRAATRLVRFGRAGTRRVTLRLSPRGRRFLGRRHAALAVTVQQRVGQGVRVTDGGYASAYRGFG